MFIFIYLFPYSRQEEVMQSPIAMFSVV